MPWSRTRNDHVSVPAAPGIAPPDEALWPAVVSWPELTTDGAHEKPVDALEHRVIRTRLPRVAPAARLTRTAPGCSLAKSAHSTRIRVDPSAETVAIRPCVDAIVAASCGYLATNPVHAVTRAKFLSEIAEIGIAHKAVRLRRLERCANQAEDNNAVRLFLKLLEQAAKECGGMYENRKNPLSRAVLPPQTSVP